MGGGFGGNAVAHDSKGKKAMLLSTLIVHHDGEARSRCRRL